MRQMAHRYWRFIAPVSVMKRLGTLTAPPGWEKSVMYSHQLSCALINSHVLTGINSHVLSSSLMRSHQPSCALINSHVLTGINSHVLSSTLMRSHQLSYALINSHALSTFMRSHHTLSSPLMCVNSLALSKRT